MDINLLKPGQIVDGRYVIQAKIGEGGMGAVYHAIDSRNFNRAVALKVINSKNQVFSAESAHLRLKREKEAYLRITHPNVVQVFDSGSTPEGDLYIVQEFILGESLENFLKKRKQLSFEDISWIVPQIASALEAAHSEGIIHRDLKPSNVMLQNLSGGGRQVKVIDFGIAKIEQSAILQPLTATGSFIGTAWYAAPEQLDNQSASPSTDLWALAVIVYEMVTGVCPYRENTISKIVISQMNGPKQPQKLRPDLPIAAQRVIMKSLRYRPEERYPEISLYCNALLESIGRRSNTESENESLEETRLLPKQVVTAGKAPTNSKTADPPTSDSISADDETQLCSTSPQTDIRTLDDSPSASKPTLHDPQEAIIAQGTTSQPPSHTLHTEVYSSKKPKNLTMILVAAGLLLTGVLAVNLYFSRETSGPLPNTSKAIPTSRPISLSYRLLVNDLRSEPFFASGREIYRSGDRFKLLVTPSDRGYLYIINEAPNGELTLLFPADHLNSGSPVVERNQEVSLPQEWYEFDKTIGAERLFLVLADEPVSELEALRYKKGEEPSKPKHKFPAAIKWLNEKKQGVRVDEQDFTTILQANDRPLVSKITIQHR